MASNGNSFTTPGEGTERECPLIHRILAPVKDQL